MNRNFALDFGEIEVTNWHANNEIYCREVRFSVPISKWNEFQNQPFFLALKKYLELLQIPDKNSEQSVEKC